MNSIEKQFEKMGARIKIEYTSGGQSINIRKDDRGSYFDLKLSDRSARVQVLNSDPKDRHLLLMVGDQLEPNPRFRNSPDKFLCGHDERDWFVANAAKNAITVKDAKEKLKPAPVLAAQRSLRGKEKNKRHNEAYIRQGEWFFIPSPNAAVDEKLILKNEPLSRGRGSKPHICEELYRSGGVAVWVSHVAPNGFTQKQYEKWQKDNPGNKSISWRPMRRDPVAYVRGKVKHADHATINLSGWHLVQMNTESAGRGRTAMAFLD